MAGGERRPAVIVGVISGGSCVGLAGRANAEASSPVGSPRSSPVVLGVISGGSCAGDRCRRWLGVISGGSYAAAPLAVVGRHRHAAQRGRNPRW